MKPFHLHNFVVHFGYTLGAGASRAVCEFVGRSDSLCLSHVRPWADSESLRLLGGGETAVESLVACVLVKSMAIAHMHERRVVHVSDVLVIIETIEEVLSIAPCTPPSL